MWQAPPVWSTLTSTVSPSQSSATDLTCCRWPEVSLRLRFQDGRQHALPYIMLQDLIFDPGSELVLDYAHCRVRIRGRKLATLFDRLADHRVRYVQEMDELASEQFPEGETVVTAIIIEKQ